MPEDTNDDLRYQSAYDAPYALRSRRGLEGNGGTTSDITEYQHLKQSIQDILSTPLGSRVLAREYGSTIHELLDQPVNDVFLARLYQATVVALRRWEPRLRVDRVSATMPAYGQVQMDIYGVVLLGGRAVRLGNLTLDFTKDNDTVAQTLPPTVRIMAAIADSGFADAEQAAQMELIRSWEPSYLLLGGDNNYPSGAASTILRNTNAYLPEILGGRAFAAVGNHEDSGGGDISTHLARFAYLPGNKRYYRQDLFGGLITLIVINTGYTSTGAATLEPDGNGSGSIQHQWVLSQIDSSNAKYVIVMGHHPFVSQVTNGGSSTRTFPALSWIRDLPKAKLYIHGHTHTAQHLLHSSGMHLLDVSASTYDRRAMSASETLYGATSGVSFVWGYADPGVVGVQHATKLIATPTALTVEVYNVVTGLRVHSFTIPPL